MAETIDAVFTEVEQKAIVTWEDTEVEYDKQLDDMVLLSLYRCHILGLKRWDEDAIQQDITPSLKRIVASLKRLEEQGFVSHD